MQESNLQQLKCKNEKLRKSISNKLHNKENLYEVPVINLSSKDLDMIWITFLSTNKRLSLEFEVSATAFDKYVEEY